MTLLERLKQVGLVFRKELERLVRVVTPLLIQAKEHKILCKKLANRWIRFLKNVNWNWKAEQRRAYQNVVDQQRSFKRYP